MPTYEAMLLVEPTAAAKDWSKVTEEIEKTVQKHGAKVVSLNKWGDRKLAYPLRKLTRGTYVLVFFEGSDESPKKIKAELMLSELVLRALILHHEGPVVSSVMPPEEVRRPMPYVPREASSWQATTR